MTPGFAEIDAQEPRDGLIVLNRSAFSGLHCGAQVEMKSISRLIRPFI